MKTEYTRNPKTQEPEKEETEMTDISCATWDTEEDKRMADEWAEKEAGKAVLGIPQEEIDRVMPEVEREVERLEKEFDEKWQEIEREFPRVEEVLNTQVDKLAIPERTEEPWTRDEFEKGGFGPIVRQPPEPKSIFGDIKLKETGEVKTEGKERILEEASLTKVIVDGVTVEIKDQEIKIHEPRTEEEIKKKESQILHELSPPQVTPEENAILKELGIPKDAEKMQRDWIKEGAEIHGKAHHLTENPQVFTPDLKAKFEKFFDECKKEDRFVSPRARKDVDEFICENYRMFFTTPEKVRENHLGVHREIDKIVIYLNTREMMEEF